MFASVTGKGQPSASRSVTEATASDPTASGRSVYSDASRPAGETPTAQPSATAGNPGVGKFYAHAYALVIGNDDYVYLPKLKNAIADSTAVANALKVHGFEVTHRQNLTADQMRSALEEFFYKTGSDKEAGLFLWYAGHGHSIGDEGYLLPIDTPTLTAGDVEFRIKAYSMRNFSTLMREARSRHILAVFDSCFAGTVFKNARAGFPPAIEEANRYPVRQFIASGDRRQEVSDDGSFRAAFVDAIMGQDPSADSDHNGYVTGEELGIFLKNRILQTLKGTQTALFTLDVERHIASASAMA